MQQNICHDSDPLPCFPNLLPHFDQMTTLDPRRFKLHNVELKVAVTGDAHRLTSACLDLSFLNSNQVR